MVVPNKVTIVSDDGENDDGDDIKIIKEVTVTPRTPVATNCKVCLSTNEKQELIQEENICMESLKETSSQPLISHNVILSKERDETRPDTSQRKMTVPNNLMRAKLSAIPVDPICNKKPKKPGLKRLREKQYCCNTNCNTPGYNFVVADEFMKEYYIQSKSNKNTHYECRTCYSNTETFVQDAKRRAISLEPYCDKTMELPVEAVITLDKSDDNIELGVNSSIKQFPHGNDLNYFERVAPEFIMRRINKKFEELNILSPLGMDGRKLEDMLEECVTAKINKFENNIKELKKEYIAVSNNIKPYFKGNATIQFEEKEAKNENEIVSPQEIIILLQSTDPKNKIDIAAPTSSSQQNSVQCTDPKNKIHLAAPTSSSEQNSVQCTDPKNKIHLAAPTSSSEQNSVQCTDPKNKIHLAAPTSSSQQNSSMSDEKVLTIASSPENNKGYRPNKQVLKVGDSVYCKSTSNIKDCWIHSEIIEIQIERENNGKVKPKLYILLGFDGKSVIYKREEKEIAYFNREKTPYTMGTRVIALYTDTTSKNYECNRYYAGVVAEPENSNNRNRCLIFFDNGTVQYIKEESIRLVAYQSPNVWEDVSPDIQNFIKTYIRKFPENKIKEMSINMLRKIELNSQWWLAHVTEVDCSLVKFKTSQGIEEWIYRGSERIGRHYYVVYDEDNRTIDISNSGTSLSKSVSHNKDKQPLKTDPVLSSEGVARKSSGKSNQSTPRENCGNTSNNFGSENIGTIVIQNFPNEPQKLYRTHALPCSAKCISEESFKEGDKVDQNPFRIPLENGWNRYVYPGGKKKKVFFYISPCGRRIKDMGELHKYLRYVNSNLGVDLFNFDSEEIMTRMLSVEKSAHITEDISDGKENVRIPCVNTISRQIQAPYVIYQTERTPSIEAKHHVENARDPGFLVCCDCTDDCSSNTKCACRKLTIDEATTFVGPTVANKFGYTYKRLIVNENLRKQAIYECNSQCKCASTCLNRVAQHNMKVQLQLFRTEKRGWGVRTLHDLPEGTFLCVYSGMILTELEANKRVNADIYLADLDYSSLLLKEGYESEVEAESLEDTMSSSVVHNTGSNTVDECKNDGVISLHTKSSSTCDRKSKVSPNVDEEELVMRKTLHDTPETFVMDANIKGNIGRWFNHSCEPNIEVRNVFLESHDPRFPSMAFFTCCYIAAGTELCWDYGYNNYNTKRKNFDPAKNIICQCATYSCRNDIFDIT